MSPTASVHQPCSASAALSPNAASRFRRPSSGDSWCSGAITWVMPSISGWKMTPAAAPIGPPCCTAASCCGPICPPVSSSRKMPTTLAHRSRFCSKAVIRLSAIERATVGAT